MTPCVYIALIHYPVINKKGRIIASSITNLDLHDIARVCRTYGVRRYFVVQPLRDQRELVKELLTYWQNGYGRVYNPDRQEALKRIKVVASLKMVLTEIGASPGPVLVATEAREGWANLSFRQARELAKSGRPMLLLFGTAWGLAPKVLQICDYVLEPLKGQEDAYNHLSVRSAAAIIIDRLLGEPWWQRAEGGQ